MSVNCDDRRSHAYKHPFFAYACLLLVCKRPGDHKVNHNLVGKGKLWRLSHCYVDAWHFLTWFWYTRFLYSEQKKKKSEITLLLEERQLHQNSFIRWTKLHSFFKEPVNFKKEVGCSELFEVFSLICFNAFIGAIRKCNNISNNLCKAIQFVHLKAVLHRCDVITSALPITWNIPKSIQRYRNGWIALK